MIIRKASMNDLEGLFPIFLEGYIYHYEVRKDVFGEPNELFLRDILIDDLCGTDKETIILIEDETIIGYIQYAIKEKNRDKILWIDEFVVTKDKRNMGYGKKLMDYIEDIAKSIKAKRIELNCWCFNTDALEMYKKRGFSNQRVVLEKDIIV